MMAGDNFGYDAMHLWGHFGAKLMGEYKLFCNVLLPVPFSGEKLLLLVSTQVSLLDKLYLKLVHLGSI